MGKILVAGLGWASAELIATRAIPLWSGARGVEFDWKYMQLSLDSNISLVQHVATTALVWLYTRHDLLPQHFSVVLVPLALSAYRPLIFECLSLVAGLGAWKLLLVKAVFSCCVALLSAQ